MNRVNLLNKEKVNSEIPNMEAIPKGSTKNHEKFNGAI